MNAWLDEGTNDSLENGARYYLTQCTLYKLPLNDKCHQFLVNYAF